MTYPLASAERDRLLAEYNAIGSQLSPDELRISIAHSRHMIRVGTVENPLDVARERYGLESGCSDPDYRRGWNAAMNRIERLINPEPPLAGGAPPPQRADSQSGSPFDLTDVEEK